jgi:hypothetical protein
MKREQEARNKQTTFFIGEIHLLFLNESLIIGFLFYFVCVVEDDEEKNEREWRRSAGVYCAFERICCERG